MTTDFIPAQHPRDLDGKFATKPGTDAGPDALAGLYLVACAKWDGYDTRSEQTDAGEFRVEIVEESHPASENPLEEMEQTFRASEITAFGEDDYYEGVREHIAMTGDFSRVVLLTKNDGLPVIYEHTVLDNDFYDDNDDGDLKGYDGALIFPYDRDPEMEASSYVADLNNAAAGKRYMVVGTLHDADGTEIDRYEDDGGEYALFDGDDARPHADDLFDVGAEQVFPRRFM